MKIKRSTLNNKGGNLKARTRIIRIRNRPLVYSLGGISTEFSVMQLLTLWLGLLVIPDKIIESAMTISENVQAKNFNTSPGSSKLDQHNAVRINRYTLALFVLPSINGTLINGVTVRTYILLPAYFLPLTQQLMKVKKTIPYYNCHSRSASLPAPQAALVVNNTKFWVVLVLFAPYLAKISDISSLKMRKG
uniref:Uncharacterized protein n=1 Tax=Glossina austeni TaxID=7395 RepID=A0A1A9V111_GLOAU